MDHPEGAEALELHLNASAKRWEMLEVARISAGTGTRPIAKMQSPGLIGSSDSSGISSTAWSHFLDSGKASKDSLEKMLSNSFKYYGTDCPEGADLEFCLKASARR